MSQWPPKLRVDPVGGMRLLFLGVRDKHFTVDQAMECLHAEDDSGNFLKEQTTDWQTDIGPNQVTCHSRVIGGVLCRWWGNGPEPEGVAILDKLTTTLSPKP